MIALHYGFSLCNEKSSSHLSLITNTSQTHVREVSRTPRKKLWWFCESRSFQRFSRNKFVDTGDKKTLFIFLTLLANNAHTDWRFHKILKSSIYFTLKHVWISFSFLHVNKLTISVVMTLWWVWFPKTKKFIVFPIILIFAIDSMVYPKF